MTEELKKEIKNIRNTYDLKLSLGDDISINNIKIINSKIHELKDFMHSEVFLMGLKMIDACLEDIENFNLIEETLNMFLDVKKVRYEKTLQIYILTTNSENSHTTQLSIADARLCIILLAIMYQRADEKKSGDIDESMAADERARDKIREINQRKHIYKKSNSGTTISDIIKRCASLGCGGYNFLTIQELTLYQVMQLLETHDKETRWNGFYGGYYSQVDLKDIKMNDIYWCNNE